MQISKYLVANSHDSLWGLTVSTVGYEEILSGEEYPTHGHADGYYFNLDKGRILNEYQLLYIIEGEGVFHSARVAEARLKAGDLFLLFPQEWHSYDELYRFAYQTALDESAYVQQTLAGVVNLLIGLMYSLERNNELNSNHKHVDMVNHARRRIRESLEADLTIQQIAKEMNVSYSNFRKLFKEFTGVSPALYQQDLRLQRAKELLTTTDLSIKQIAYQLRFESPDYFSSKFKIKTGMKPSDFREQTR